MKIREGFVSNSSSTSFTVVFPEVPLSVEHLRKMMFPEIFYLSGNKKKKRITPEKICECVWKKMHTAYQGNISIKNLAYELFQFDLTSSCGPLNHAWCSEDICDPINIMFHTMEKSDYQESVDANIAWHKLWCSNYNKPRKSFYQLTEEEQKQFRIEEAKVDELFKITAKKKAKELLSIARKIKGCVRIMEFEDHNTEVEAFCEKGDVFKNLVHISINQH